MVSINKLTAADTLAGGDQLAVFTQDSGDTRKASMTVIAETVDTLNTESVKQYVRQGASPSSTGFTVQVTDGSDNIWLILTETAAFATGTISMPTKSGIIDNQEVLIYNAETITAVTFAANGAGSIIGAPGSLGADDFITFKYDLTTDAWYRVR